MTRKQIPLVGLLVALAFVLSYLESIIPFSMGIPGVKLGIANLVVLIALYRLNTMSAFLISLVRIVLAGITFGSLYSMLYALAGGLFSFFVMILLKKTEIFSTMGISMAGAVFHNVGQILVAVFITDTVYLLYYLPILLVSGLFFGFIIGLIGNSLLKRLMKFEVNGRK